MIWHQQHTHSMPSASHCMAASRGGGLALSGCVQRGWSGPGLLALGISSQHASSRACQSQPPARLLACAALVVRMRARSAWRACVASVPAAPQRGRACSCCLDMLGLGRTVGSGRMRVMCLQPPPPTHRRSRGDGVGQSAPGAALQRWSACRWPGRTLSHAAHPPRGLGSGPSGRGLRLQGALSPSGPSPPGRPLALYQAAPGPQCIIKLTTSTTQPHKQRSAQTSRLNARTRSTARRTHTAHTRPAWRAACPPCPCWRSASWPQVSDVCCALVLA